MSSLVVTGIPNGSFAVNTWLLVDETSGDAVVVDPGEEHQRILAAIRHRGANVKAIWLTHAHIDHIFGVEPVRRATGAPVWLHPADRDWYDRLPDQCAHFGFSARPAPSPPEHALADGDTVSLGPWRFEVRHTPGHSPGSVSFLGHGLAISGDVLFLGSVGRTDLPGGDGPTLIRSIRNVLFSLDDDTRVLPGHGPETTIGRERALNPYVGKEAGQHG
ncbi:MAG TPA: MBL fold metallo-hydrolase [Gemmatimonadales bacterium]|nr:MBL fold metallo-hydrolase [Gemmatimonadales bacterium]